MIWDSQRHSFARLGRRLLVMITILAIAGTLSACGRYGSPVRSSPVAVGTTAPEGVGEAGASAEIGAAEAKSKGPANGEGSDRQDEDEDEDEMAEEIAE